MIPFRTRANPGNPHFVIHVTLIWIPVVEACCIPRAVARDGTASLENNLHDPGWGVCYICYGQRVVVVVVVVMVVVVVAVEWWWWWWG